MRKLVIRKSVLCATLVLTTAGGFGALALADQTAGKGRIKELAWMTGLFRWSKKGAAWMFELLTITEEGSDVVFRFRHFGRNLHAWEEKTEPLVLKLVESSAGRAVFESSTHTKPKHRMRTSDETLRSRITLTRGTIELPG